MLWLRLSIPCWIKTVWVNMTVSFLMLKEKLWAFQHTLPVGLSYMTFIKLRYITSITILRFFMLHFVKCFFSIYWDHPMIFVLHVVNMVYHTDLKMVSLPWIPGINPTWSWYMILLIYHGISLLRCCWGFLHGSSSEILVSNFLLL